MGFGVTAFQNVTNTRGFSLLFINTESSQNNREIDPQATVSVDNCWIPWCFKADDFAGHHIEIIDRDGEAPVWYIWQQDNPAVIVASTEAFVYPATPIHGSSAIEKSYNLFIGPGDNDLSANLAE
jgi:hypothetical protein